jgi:hypothetical protein
MFVVLKGIKIWYSGIVRKGVAQATIPFALPIGAVAALFNRRW